MFTGIIEEVGIVEKIEKDRENLILYIHCSFLDEIKITQSLAKNLGGTAVVLDSERDVARLVFQGWTIDFATQVGASLDDDLWRRDFTLNAIALLLEPHPKIIDPTC